MNKQIVILLLLLAFFSVPFTTIAVPSSRSLKPHTVVTHIVSNQHLYNHSIQRKGRMDMEIADYSETGANNHHDPNPPGSS